MIDLLQGLVTGLAQKINEIVEKLGSRKARN